MAGQLRIQPHRTARAECVEWGAWWATIRGVREPVDRRIEGWDYATALQLDFEPHVDVKQLLEQTALGDADGIEVVGQIDCPATFQRATVRAPLTDLLDGSSRLSLELMPGLFADRVQLSRHIVLATPRTDRGDGVAYRAGSRLAESGVARLKLEGDGGRFPVEALPFSTIGREDAAWALDVMYEDLDDSFLGAVRLVVNTEHPAADPALDRSHPLAPIVTSVLRHDLVRQLIVCLSSDLSVDFDKTEDFESDSLGAVVANLCDLYLRRDLSSVVQLLRSEPSQFELLLQARLDFLRIVRI